MSRSIADPRRRKLVAWRAARVSAVASSALSWERFSAVKRLLRNLFLGGSAVHVRALVRPCPAAHAPRVQSRDARTMRRPQRSPSAYPRTCCGSSRCVSRSSAARVRGFPAIPKRAILFRDARIALGRSRGLRHARALHQSLTRSFPPPFRARRHRPNATSEPHLGIASTHHRNHLNHLNRAPSRGSRTSARARRGFRARSSREASPATRLRQGS